MASSRLGAESHLIFHVGVFDSFAGTPGNPYTRPRFLTLDLSGPKGLCQFGASHVGHWSFGRLGRKLSVEHVHVALLYYIHLLGLHRLTFVACFSLERRGLNRANIVPCTWFVFVARDHFVLGSVFLRAGLL